MTPKGLPEFPTSAAGVREERKHFQTIVFFLNILIYANWGGNVPLFKIKKWSQRENDLQSSPLCALTPPMKSPIKNVNEQASYSIGKLGKIIQGQIVKIVVTLLVEFSFGNSSVDHG